MLPTCGDQLFETNFSLTLMYYDNSQNIIRVKCGVDLSLGIRRCCVIISRFDFNKRMP